MAIEERSETVQVGYKRELADLKARKMEFSEMEALRAHPAWKIFKDRQERVIKNYEIEIHNKLTLPPDESYSGQVRELHAAKSAIRNVLDCVENPGEILAKIDARMMEVKAMSKKTGDED